VRLIGAVKRLEGAARSRTRPAKVGIVWTSNEERVNAAELGPAEWIAVDISVRGGATPTAPVYWRIKERITGDPSDLGLLSDETGARVGRVVSIDGDLLRYELDEARGKSVEFLRRPAGE